MRWVWIAVAAWAVLSIPLALLAGHWLRSLGNAPDAPGRQPGRPPARRRRGGPSSLPALLPGVHTAQPRRLPRGPTTNPGLAVLSHRPRPRPPATGAADEGPADDRRT